MKRALVLLVTCAAALLNAATYYVDSAWGSDSNSGLSPDTPWRTLERIKATPFKPGDRILLKRGCAWQGQLATANSGAEGAPIVIDAYDRGQKPRIDGGGTVEDAVLLYNVQHIEVRNLEITNAGEKAGVRRGVHIYLDNFGTAKHIVIADLYIHDVNGTNKIKDNGGIIFRTKGDKTPSRFDGLTIERNLIVKVDRSAIAAQSYHWRRTQWFPSLNVVIRDNYADDIGGDGIVPWATERVLVEHNIVRNCNRRANTYNAGIWPWSADNSVFQLNEAAFTRTTLDGQGFDSDYNSRNTMFQYNYSHDNEGGFMLICSPGKRNAAENLGNTGTVVRYNISRNDLARIFHLSAAEQTTVHDNAIYVGPKIDVQMLIVTDWTGWADGAVFRNNTFFVEGAARYGHQSGRAEDGTYKMAPGWGPAKNIIFEGNRYIGKHIDAPEDPKGSFVQSAAAPKLDWNAPVFDASRPDTLPEFMRRHRRWMLRLFERQFGKKPELAQ